MPKSIYLTDEQWSQVAAHAVSCGFFVGRGPKSQLAKFVVEASEWAHNNGLQATGLGPGETVAESNQSGSQSNGSEQETPCA